jgi:hypothetical protein
VRLPSSSWRVKHCARRSTPQEPLVDDGRTVVPCAQTSSIIIGALLTFGNSI